MSEDMRWEVGDRYAPTHFEFAFDTVCEVAERGYPMYEHLQQEEAEDFISFIVSLVHYIGELQGEIIEKDDAIRWMLPEIYAISKAYISPEIFGVLDND